MLHLGQFAEAVKRVDASVSGRDLIRAATSQRGPADTRLDIADPYSRGPEAAQSCATQVTALLDVVLPVLTRTP